MTSANDVVQTHNCRMPGCTLEARSTRGPYAYLCDEHIAQKRARTAEKAPGPTPASLSAKSFVERTQALTTLAKKVDRAFARAERLRKSVEPAVRRAKAAKEDAERLAEEYRRAVSDLAGGS